MPYNRNLPSEMSNEQLRRLAQAQLALEQDGAGLFGGQMMSEPPSLTQPFSGSAADIASYGQGQRQDEIAKQKALTAVMADKRFGGNTVARPDYRGRPTFVDPSYDQAPLRHPMFAGEPKPTEEIAADYSRPRQEGAHPAALAELDRLRQARQEAEYHRAGFTPAPPGYDPLTDPNSGYGASADALLQSKTEGDRIRALRDVSMAGHETTRYGAEKELEGNLARSDAYRDIGMGELKQRGAEWAEGAPEREALVGRTEAETNAISQALNQDMTFDEFLRLPTLDPATAIALWPQIEAMKNGTNQQGGVPPVSQPIVYGQKPASVDVVRDQSLRSLAENTGATAFAVELRRQGLADNPEDAMRLIESYYKRSMWGRKGVIKPAGDTQLKGLIAERYRTMDTPAHQRTPGQRNAIRNMERELGMPAGSL